MLPIRDVNPTRSFAWVTAILIAINVLVFLYELALPSPKALYGLVHAMGLVPYRVSRHFSLAVLPTFFTSMFLHAGFVHLLSNMLFLWIFGNNVEDTLGRLPFTLFYFLCGLGAGAVQVAVNPNSLIPTIGASGAISGVLGGYMLLFPRARVYTLLFVGWFIRLVELPAVMVLGLWIALQFLQGLISLGMPQVGGVAWFAHIGGFLTGVLLVKLFPKRQRWLS